MQNKEKTASELFKTSKSLSEFREALNAAGINNWREDDFTVSVHLVRTKECNDLDCCLEERGHRITEHYREFYEYGPAEITSSISDTTSSNGAAS